jgi:integrase
VPKLKNKEAWVSGLRTAIRSSSAKGWTVREHRGLARLEVRTGNGMRSAQLMKNNIPFTYSAQNMGDIITRVRNIYVEMSNNGGDFDSAVAVCAGLAPKLTYSHDWVGAKDDFEKHKKEMGNGISDGTWIGEYEPVITYAVNLLKTKDSPINADKLLEICAKNGIEKVTDYMARNNVAPKPLTYELGCRSREQRVRNLSAFLRYCVTKKNYPSDWFPPDDLSEYIGRPSKKAKLAKNKKASIEDQEFINLINSLPTDTGQPHHIIAARKWVNAMKLCAVFGLRPIELRHLVYKKRKDELWCMYEKRSGQGVTKARILEPLYLTDDEGNVHYEEVVRLYKANLLELPYQCLPTAESVAGVGDQMGKWLKDKAGWKSLKALMAKRGESLGCYSFRHSYSLRGHQLGIDAGSVADAMGHTLRTHLESYDYAKTTTTKKAFKKARELQAV